MSKKLRIAIDVSAAPQELTGAGYYMKEIVSNLDPLENIDLYLITKKNDFHRWTEVAPNAKIINTAPDSLMFRVAYQTFKLGSLVDSLKVDLFHGPHYQIPVRMQTPSVVTIHDMTLITHPLLHARSKTLLFGKMIPYATRNAKHIISVSHHTSTDIIRIYEDIVPEKITVAPLGVNTKRFHEVFELEENNEDLERLKRRGIQGRYIAFLGLIEPRKSLPTLIEAFARVTEKFPEHKLVIAGGTGWGIDGVNQSIIRSGISSKIIMPGRLSDEEVSALLRQCEAFVYPSMYEGFGMPVIEAMACGAPVITSDSSSLAEVAGDAAILVRPQNINSLKEALLEILGSEEKQLELSQAGIARAKEFTWDNCVELHIKAYEQALLAI